MLKAIEQRQSIRKYKNTLISDEQVSELLKAGMNAPSARNEQPWSFIVIRNRKVLDEVALLSPYTSMLKSAPCAILVLGDKSKVNALEYLYYDCAAAIENMLIEATAMNLGTCWCAIAPREERIAKYRSYFKLPDHIEPLSIVALGVSDEQRPLVDTFDASRVSYID